MNDYHISFGNVQDEKDFLAGVDANDEELHVEEEFDEFMLMDGLLIDAA